MRRAGWKQGARWNGGPVAPNQADVRNADAVPLEPAAREQVDGERPQPVAALVVLAGDANEAGVAMRAGGSLQRRDPPVARWQARSDALEHPGAAQVEAVDVGQLGITAVGDDARPQPGRGGVEG